MPFGGKYQQTPIQAMVHKVSVEKGETDTCSFMAWGYNPFITEKARITVRILRSSSLCQSSLPQALSLKMFI